MTYKKIISWISILTLTSSLTSTAADDFAEDGKAFLTSFLTQIAEVKNSNFMSPKGQLAMTEKLFHENIDFVYMSAQALGGRSSTLPPTQFAEFTYEFERFLTHKYLSRIASHRPAGVDILDIQSNTMTGKVVISLLGGTHEFAMAENTNERSKIDYVLMERSGKWNIINVIIDGKNLSSDANPELKAFIFNKTFHELIGKLRAINNTIEGYNPYEEES